MAYSLSDPELTDGLKSQEDLKSTPVKTTLRIESLDILRGIALLGALLISIWTFGGFSQNMQTKLLLHPSGGNYRLFAAVSLLFEGKMRAIIALVFGAVMVINFSKANTINALSNADVSIRRFMWLIAFGLLNAFLFLWTNDILFHLGVTGILLFAFVRMKARGLLIAALLTTLIYCGKNYWRYQDDNTTYKKYLSVVAIEKSFKKDSTDLLTKNKKKEPLVKPTATRASTLKKDSSAQKKDTLTRQQQEDKSAWEGLVKNMKYDSTADARQAKQMREGAYGTLWNTILPEAQWREAGWTYRTGIWDLASMMFLGMALFKLDFFTGRFSNSRYLTIALITITAGLLLGWYRLYFHNAMLLDYAKFIKRYPIPHNLFFPLERVFLACGYAALIIFLLRIKLLKGLFSALADTGKMALTNYLVQSIFFTLFFTGFGMTNFGKLEQHELYLLVAEVWMVQVIFSTLWMRFYYYGPFEWLWRYLIYGKAFPNKKTVSATPEPAIAAII
ncbi:MAG: DUF418 domain-containing protein [Bacteroidota bacterium]